MCTIWHRLQPNRHLAKRTEVKSTMARIANPRQHGVANPRQYGVANPRQYGAMQRSLANFAYTLRTLRLMDFRDHSKVKTSPLQVSEYHHLLLLGVS
jgi:hypothetical protein